MPQRSTATLSYTTQGNPKNPAILLLHGFMSCNDQWLLNRRALAAHHYLILVELWGHGKSPAPAAANHYSIEEYIEQFESIREALQIDRWHLVGQSYGAGIVLNYAHQKPEYCLSLVTTNSRSAFGQLSSKNSAAASNKPLPTLANNRQLPFHPIHARRFPNWVKDKLVKNADAIPAEALRLGSKLGAALNCIDLLGEITPPLLITNGRYEKAFQHELQKLAAQYPLLEVANLEGGHSANIEAADAFNQVVLDFFSRPKTNA